MCFFARLFCRACKMLVLVKQPLVLINDSYVPMVKQNTELLIDKYTNVWSSYQRKSLSPRFNLGINFSPQHPQNGILLLPLFYMIDKTELYYNTCHAYTILLEFFLFAALVQNPYVATSISVSVPLIVCVTVCGHATIRYYRSGPRLNIKTVLSTYGDFHVKDKTAVRTSYL